MEREQYRVMREREDHHWWYVGMRRTALALLDDALAGRRNLSILDAGCGTGGTTVHLRRFGQVTGVDLAWEGLRPAAQRGLAGHLARASVEHLPFRDAAFDVVTSFEVVYHLDVGNDRTALEEFRRVLTPGGLLLLRVPAHDWLRGAHDRLVHTRHRYEADELRGKLADAGFRIDRLSWANSLLLPAAATKRLLEGALPDAGRQGAAGQPDLWQPPAPLNALLEQLVAMEALLIPRGLGLPFGLSLLAVARVV